MELTLTYILSQVFIILNYIFLIITYQLKDRNKILFFNICSLTSAGLSYICLSAYTGIAMVIISILRNILFLFNEKKNGISKNITKNDIYMLIVIYILTIVFAIFKLQLLRFEKGIIYEPVQTDNYLLLNQLTFIYSLHLNIFITIPEL